MTAKLLLLEDDPAIARTVAYALERDGLQVTHSLLVHDARQQMASHRFDLLVLDVGLPDGSGLDLLRDVRNAARTASLPVLMLSAHGEEIDRVLGLELGADDYLTKPFSPRELAARVKALLRRAGNGASSTPAIAAPLFQDDEAGQRISLRGQALLLTRREYRLLSCLLRGAGRIHSRDALLAAAWGDDSESTDRTVDTHIKTLRAKLREVDPAREYISTHRGMGYCLDV
ncbi:MAG: two-component system response regulator CreB [Gammaproteobacteria bacterium]|jgi:two-component system, OmpR family, catabolic regulation response regulator CreB|nr:two-component system response regulator CreB [Gammaproteobacteria bacterium]MBU1507947.1 two-component system response regulator CreB [Gammaproteobacteria bacterium]MBU2121445.1 two-component system response regulator CreB [Gammaproteobacteria bacterium]MBU2172306.1 two-component system response regulator CreB [Gammaproteobacteria bacterium]MBU2200332.1 two-component system response regulator CreB [Gammaproteobacteria bacterium]